MYMANQLADFQNRMSLFLAKMIEDGAYEAHYLKEKDLPNENGVVIVSNQLLKVFSEFVISKELCNKLLYLGIEDIEEIKE